MRMFALALLATTAACAPTDRMAGDKVMPEPTASYTPGGPGDPVMVGCNAAKAQALVGRNADTAVQEEARRLSGARTLRVLPPGAMMTMDYRSDRLNIKTDAAGKILSFDCG